MRTIVLALLLSVSASASELDARVARSINSVRASHGLRALAPNPALEAAARSQCVWMAREGRMEHLRPPARSFEEFLSCEHHPANRVVKAGYFKFEELFRVERNQTGAVVVPLPAANDKVGEIVARGEGGPGAYDYRTVVRGWMNSPGHRTEILKPQYTEMGVAVCSPRGGETYWCVVFGCR